MNMYELVAISHNTKLNNALSGIPVMQLGCTDH